MGVPFAPAAAAEKMLDEQPSPLDTTTRHQSFFDELFGLRSVEAIKAARGFLFTLELKCFRNGTLHLESEFVSLDPGTKVLVIGIINSSDMIKFSEETEIIQLFFSRDRA